MRRLTRLGRQYVALVVSVALVVGIGLVGLLASTRASERAEAIHRDDRMTLQRALAGLTEQYLKFALKESFDFASSRPWALTPDDAGDRAALERFTNQSALLQQGAAIVGLDQKPLTSVARPPGLPGATDPGFIPLVQGLLAGGPGLSAVMHVGDTPEVALGVPVLADGKPVAVLVTFFNAQTAPLEEYTQKLRYGATDRGFVVDSAGVAVATSRGPVGHHAPATPALALMQAGRSGFREYRRDGVDLIASFSPVGIGGWGVVTEQRSSEFFGPIRSSRARVNLALLALLVAAASGLAVLNHKRATAMARINHQAFHDTLTGLPNRALFHAQLDLALARARRRNEDVAVLFLDLDRFKVVNDSLGHDVGDQVLVEVGQRIASVIRAEDTFARMGGDEFTILLECEHQGIDALTVAERVLDTFNTPISVSGHDLHLTASIGIALCEKGDGSGDDLLRDADLAMYRAKDNGKGCYERFEISMGEEARRKLGLEIELRRAIDDGELVLHYQPIVDLEDRAVVGAEALVRWQHPERGLLAPGEFLPLAEETGLAIPLGRWVLDAAFTQLRTWTEHDPDRRLRMNVNLGPAQIGHRQLVADVAAALNCSGADPARVMLELNETAIMDDATVSVERLTLLRDLGVELAIDDFGTGYASISWLKRLPLSMLKLDGVFVRDLETNHDDAAIARAIIGLARELRIAVTAEQVETTGQLHALRAMHCRYGQGNYFAAPVEAAQFESLIGIRSTVTLS